MREDSPGNYITYFGPARNQLSNLFVSDGTLREQLTEEPRHLAGPWAALRHRVTLAACGILRVSPTDACAKCVCIRLTAASTPIEDRPKASPSPTAQAR